MTSPNPSFADLPVPSWTGKSLRRLGGAIRDNLPPPATGPSYSDVVTYYDDLAVCVLNVIERLDWERLLPHRAVQLTSRAKTIDTLRDKLQRDRATPLGNIQDIAGVRLEAEMTLDEQDEIVTAVVAAFGHDPSSVHDLRENPHSGYRAVHVWLRLPGGRVEVQVRTHVQGAWANAYEELADVVGRYIRYDDALPDGERERTFVLAMRNEGCKWGEALEQARNSAGRVSRAAPDDPEVTIMAADIRELEGQFTQFTQDARAMFKGWV